MGMQARGKLKWNDGWGTNRRVDDGMRAPTIREIARQFRDVPLPDIAALLQSPVHEVRLAGLLILVDRFGKAQSIVSLMRLTCPRPNPFTSQPSSK